MGSHDGVRLPPSSAPSTSFNLSAPAISRISLEICASSVEVGRRGVQLQGETRYLLPLCALLTEHHPGV